MDDDFAEDDFEEEVLHNVIELKELVKSIEIVHREFGSGKCQYKIIYLEGGEPHLVEFHRGKGYHLGKKNYETMQSLLSENSPMYRVAFAKSISDKLNEINSN